MNQINPNIAGQNGNVGLYLGCDADGTTSAPCNGVGPSNKNHLFDSSYIGNTNYGVAIDLGNTKNIVTDVTAHSNGIQDLFDANQNCGGNQWFGNSFVNNNAPCIE